MKKRSQCVMWRPDPRALCDPAPFIPLSRTDCQRFHLKIDILNPQPDGFGNSQTATIEKLGDQERHTTPFMTAMWPSLPWSAPRVRSAFFAARYSIDFFI